MPKLKDVPKQVHEISYYNSCAKELVMHESNQKVKNLVTKLMLLYYFNIFQMVQLCQTIAYTLSQHIIDDIFVLIVIQFCSMWL